MIPLQLTLKGLYSYREETRIDFARLTEGRLFGIFGSVGSGKSALLEAITYALFGETERLNNRENRGYNMMNLKSSELWIDFEFKIGVGEEDRYRFTVSQKRNSKRFQEVGAAKRLAYRFKDGEWHALAHTDASHVLGLSYDHFIKTIIIPQGKFQDFLAMGAADRSKMLKEIFELHRFDLSAKTKLLNDRNAEGLRIIEGQLLELQHVDPEQIQEREAELRRLEADFEKDAHEKVKLDASLKLFEIIKNLIDEIEAIHELLDPMEEDVPTFEARTLVLQRYEEAKGRFQDLIDAQARQSKAQADARLAQTVAAERLDRLKAEALSGANQYAAARAAFEGRDRLQQEAQDWKRLGELSQVNTEIEELSLRMQNGRLHIDEQHAIIQKQQAALASLVAELEALKLALPDLNQLYACNSWHKEAATLSNALDRAEEDVKRSTAALEKGDADIRRLEDGPEGHPELVQTNLAAQQTESKARLAQLQTHVRLVDFSSALQDGEPCPLCGSLSHPQPMDVGNIDAERAGIEAEANQLDAAMKANAIILQQLAAAQAMRGERQLALERFQQVKSAAAAQMEAHNSSFQWEEAWRFDAAHVIALLASAKSLTEAYEAKQAERDLARQQIEKADGLRQKFEQAIGELKIAEAESRMKGQTLKRQIQVLSVDEDSELNAGSCQAKAAEAIERFHQIGKEHFIAEESHKKLAASLRDEELALERANALAESAAASLAQVEAQLRERFEGSSFVNEAEVQAILAEALDVRREREEIEAFKTDLHEQRISLRSKQVELGDQQYNADAHRSLRTEHSILLEKMQESSVEKGRLVEQLERVKADQKRRDNLLEHSTALRDRAANLDTLAKLFKANGFVDYVSSVYLKDLCIAANARFAVLTRNRLRLEVSADNSFEVRDMVNGGEIRSVKTLSGGQTFQAALSLALALADSIQQRNRSAYNFFFLDEGFGSLDRESLQIVFETLKNLQKEDRVVGVISHVEELQQEIDTYLSVRQDDERGSQVTPSWRT